MSRTALLPAADPLSLEALRFLSSSPGQRLLARAASLAGDELRAQEALRAEYPAPWCRAALALVELRRAAAAKFPAADRMYFDRPGLEMASAAVVADHRARRFARYGTVLDLCCGIGGDLLALARGSSVLAVDLDRRRLEMARLNARALDRPQVCLVAADVCRLRLAGDAAFVDPARRLDDGTRQRSAASYSPPLSWLTELRRRVPATAAKLSPAIDEAELPTDGELEWVSWRGQCREAVCYFGPLATARRRATVLPAGDSLTEALDAAPVPVGPPGPFLFDPDPAVVRAHLIEPLARQLGAWLLDRRVAYLCAETGSSTPFASAYRVLEWMPFQLKRLRQRLAGEGFFPVEIKKRAVAMEPDELRQRLGLRGGSRPVTLVHTRVGQSPLVAICEKWTG